MNGAVLTVTPHYCISGYFQLKVCTIRQDTRGKPCWFTMPVAVLQGDEKEIIKHTKTFCKKVGLAFISGIDRSSAVLPVQAKALGLNTALNLIK